MLTVTCGRSVVSWVTPVSSTNKTDRYYITDIVVTGTDRIVSCKSNYHTTVTTTAPGKIRNTHLFIKLYSKSNKEYTYKRGCMVLNAAFNNISVISWRSVLLVEETRLPGENDRAVSSHKVALSTPLLSGIQAHNCGDWHWLHVFL